MGRTGSGRWPASKGRAEARTLVQLTGNPFPQGAGDPFPELSQPAVTPARLQRCWEEGPLSAEGPRALPTAMLQALCSRSFPPPSSRCDRPITLKSRGRLGPAKAWLSPLLYPLTIGTAVRFQGQKPLAEPAPSEGPSQACFRDPLSPTRGQPSPLSARTHRGGSHTAASFLSPLNILWGCPTLNGQARRSTARVLLTSLCLVLAEEYQVVLRGSGFLNAQDKKLVICQFKFSDNSFSDETAIIVREKVITCPGVELEEPGQSIAVEISMKNGSLLFRNNFKITRKQCEKVCPSPCPITISPCCACFRFGCLRHMEAPEIEPGSLAWQARTPPLSHCRTTPHV
ncbi:uncharacterized protein LOC143653343 [Tamandua tetradactyla]|uniref:uncharacterized protein LOC143653343 n=1 Tax=Tamandua tetradactyla TaxID=48850 RepID=UPI004053FA55